MSADVRRLKKRPFRAHLQCRSLRTDTGYIGNSAAVALFAQSDHGLAAVRKGTRPARICEGQICNGAFGGDKPWTLPCARRDHPLVAVRKRARPARVFEGHVGSRHLVGTLHRHCAMHSATKPRSSTNTRATRVHLWRAHSQLALGGTAHRHCAVRRAPTPSLHFENARGPRAFLEGTFEIGTWLQSENARDPRAFSKRTFAIGTWMGHFIDTALCTPRILTCNVS